MPSALLWLLAGLLAAGILVAAVVLLETRPAPASASVPGHGMDPGAMCRHMPEHCGNASPEAPT